MLKVKYGTHEHDSGECSFSLDRQTLFDETNVPFAILCRYTITGVLTADSTSAMSTEIETLKDAYSVHNKDLLLLDDSNNVMENSIYVTNTRNGIRVTKPPSFPTAPGGVYVTYQPYTIELEAEIAVSSGSNIRFFTESVEQIGGGPRFMMIESNVGPPIRQRVREQTIYRYVQAGTAVGIDSRPAPPAPLWPEALIESGRIRKTSPTRMGFGVGLAWQNYEISWQYEFESARPLKGEPRVLGRTYLR